MKSSERIIAVLGIIIAVVGGVQAALLLPYRVEQVEHAQAEHIKDFNTEKAKSVENRESLIRIEEQLKAVRVTVEEIARQHQAHEIK